MRKHIIINVGRQLGSGGRIIGSRIAEDFNIKFYDKELLDLAAKESGFNKKFFERNDEHKGFLKILFSSFAPIFGSSDYIHDGTYLHSGRHLRRWSSRLRNQRNQANRG